MEKFKYVILHDLNAEKRNNTNLSRDITVPDIGPSTSSNIDELIDTPPDLSIESDSLTSSQAFSELQNPRTISVAREMPLKLIEAMNIEGGNTPQALSGENTWGVEAVGANQSEFDGDGITVAVLDTGIKKEHPAFQDPTLELVQENFTNEESTVDNNGHGTHCAGTIFGRDVNHAGSLTRIGIARGVKKALIGKVIGEGAGTHALLSSITWARDNGAHVISMSLGYDHAALNQALLNIFPPDKAASELLAIYLENMRQFDSLVQHLSVPVAGGVNPVIVAASGNESNANDPVKPYRISASSPSAALRVVTVGAVGQASGNKLGVAAFSNTGVNVVAPGVGVLSAGLNNDLVSLNGTSMACPHVAGLATLYWQDVLRLGLPPTAENVKSLLLANSKRDSLLPVEEAGDIGLGIPVAPGV